MSHELTEEEIKYASPEDIKFFNDAIKGLPTREGFKGNFMDKDNVEIPYGSEAHILKYFRKAIEIVKPTYVLEIGFNIGYGAAMLLAMGLVVHSIDISEKWETKYAALFLETQYKNDFHYYDRSDFLPISTKYDMCFIDGGHEEEDVTADIELCKQLKILYLLFDDCYEKYGPGVLPSIAKFPELELVKDMNNLRLYKIN